MDNAIQIYSLPVGMPWFDSVDVEQDSEVESFEHFVDEHVVARFLQIAPRRVLEMARTRQIPAHPLGRARKTWRFRMSEVDAHFSAPRSKQPGTAMSAISPGHQGNKRRA
jgi:hypothetical protein